MNSYCRPSALFRILSFLGCLVFAASASAQTIDVRPAASKDDAEQRADLSMYSGSSDLELTFDGSTQTIGIRWPGIAIPAGATITSAWVQFNAAGSQTEQTDLVFAGEATSNALAFTSTAGNISGRPRTGATVAWSNLPAWTSGETLAAQKTPQLKTIIQEIVNRAGWASGNALVLIITGTGHRTATSWDGGAANAPLLHVEYTTSGGPPPDSPPVAVLNVSQAASPARTVNASAAGSTDTDATPIASYTFAWGDGTANTTVNAPTQTASHTYASAGTYTVTLTAKDTGNLTSAPVTKSITVNPPNTAPTAALSVSQVASPARTVSASAAGSTDPESNLASYTFSWGDGTSNTTVNHPTQTASHTYASAGTYTVTVTAKDTGNLTSAPVTQSINVNAAPVAVLNVSQAASPARTVDASAVGSTDNDAFPIASYTFSWGDGTPSTTVNAPTETASHTYAVAGTYTVTLTAKDTGNLTSAAVTKSISVNAAPVAALSVSVLAPPTVRTVSASASGSTDADAFPIASYTFSWGDGTPSTVVNHPNVTTTHSYAVAGTYTVSLTATDTGNLTSAPVTQNVTVNDPPPVIFDALPGADSDDAEESATGSVSTSSGDLELVFDGNNQTVGIRWPNLGIYPGATIQKAWVQFTADESQNEVTNLTLRAQAADNAATFTSSSLNVSSRARTATSVSWANIAPWTTGQVTAAQKTPELKTLIQEVVSRPGWAMGNAIALIITGTGHRTAEAAQGSTTIWAKLHIEFTGGTPPPNQPPVAALNVTAAGMVANASAAGSTDPDVYGLASYRFTWGDGTAATVVNHPTQTASHTYAASGTYTVTVTATDIGGLTSAPVTRSVTVSSQTGPPIAVWASYYSTHHSYNIQPKPSPWMGSPNVVFVGTPDSPSSGGWDSGGIKIDNQSGASMTMTVTCQIGSKTFSLWGSRSVPAGQSLILAQTGFENFDGSDTNPAGCYDCDPKLCLTAVQSTVPVVNVTISGTTTKYYDTQQTINTNGVDYAGCPKTSGRNDESRGWVRIYTSSPAEAPPAATNMFEGDPSTEVLGLSWMSPVFPNPARVDLTLQFRIGQRGSAEIAIYDVAGRLVRNELTREFEPGQYQKTIPVDDLSAGMYYCTLRTKEGTLRQSFSIAR